MTMTRDELIEKALLWMKSTGFDAVYPPSNQEIAENYADFCLPLLEQARQESMERCAAQYAAERKADIAQALPEVLAAERERAIEEGWNGGVAESYAATFEADNMDDARKLILKLLRRALRAPSEEQRERSPDGGTAREKVPQEGDTAINPGSSPGAPTSLHQRAEELLLMDLPTRYWPTGAALTGTIDAMLAFAAEREHAGWKRGWDALAKYHDEVLSKDLIQRGARDAFAKAAEMARFARGFRYGFEMLEKKLAALAAPAQHEKPEAGSGECKPAEATADRSTTRDASSADASPPALHSDADTLERAAEILERDKALPWRPEIATDIRHVASQLRARPAPQDDWADAVAREWYKYEQPNRGKLAALLRERLGECVGCAQWMSEHGYAGSSVEVMGSDALARLRGEKEKA